MFSFDLCFDILCITLHKRNNDVHYNKTFQSFWLQYNVAYIFVKAITLFQTPQLLKQSSTSKTALQVEVFRLRGPLKISKVNETLQKNMLYDKTASDLTACCYALFCHKFGTVNTSYLNTVSVISWHTFLMQWSIGAKAFVLNKTNFPRYGFEVIVWKVQNSPRKSIESSLGFQPVW